MTNFMSIDLASFKTHEIKPTKFEKSCLLIEINKFVSTQFLFKGIVSALRRLV